jgi:NIMA (never in mitosis gene a)-related kinase
MEYAEGGDLSARIKYHAKYRAHFSESRVLAWFSQLVSAVHTVHTFGLIHRDIKPANVFFVSNKVKLGDFGVTCNAARSDGTDGRTTPIGTPMYMPPEVVGGDTYHQAADMWALGCVLFEMMALAPAFVGRSLGSVLRKIRKGVVDEALLPEEYSRDLIGLLSVLQHIIARSSML